MKRILLITSLLSLAAQVPVHAESKIVKWVQHPENQKAMKYAGKAVIADTKSLGNMAFKAIKNGYNALPSIPSFDSMLQTGDTIVKAPFKAYVKHPALMTALSIGATIGTSAYLWNQSRKALNNNEHDKAKAYDLGAILTFYCGIFGSALAGASLSISRI